MKKTNNETAKNNYHNISILLLILSALIIGALSPSGLFKCLFTFGIFYVFLNFHNIIHPLVTFIFNFIYSAGNTKLQNDKIINPKSISTVLVLILFIQCFFVNYLFHRYTGILIFDPFAIYFWISSYGINILYNYIFKKNCDDFVLRTPSIITSAIKTILFIQIFKIYPDFIHIPEQYAAVGENVIFRLFFSEYLPPRYQTRL